MSTMSSSPRKPRTTGSSSAPAGLLAAVLVALTLTGCRRSSGEVFLTHLTEQGLSLRHPASWQVGEAAQAGLRYSYVVPPPLAGSQQSSAFVTVLDVPTTMPLDDYARSYLANQKLDSSREEERQGIAGRSWDFASADGQTRARLLLLAMPARIVGLHAQAESATAATYTERLDQIWASFTIERPERYPVQVWKDFGVSLGVPESWKQTRQFSGGGTMLVQFASPPLAAEKRQTIHAGLSVTLERAPQGGLTEYYDTTRRNLGDNFVVISHQPTKNGFVDVMRTESSLAVSFIERYYLVEGERACSLSFDARDDVFPHSSRWADLIASTLRLGATAPAATPKTAR